MYFYTKYIVEMYLILNTLYLEIKMKQNVIVKLNLMYYTVLSTIHQMYLNTFYCI